MVTKKFFPSLAFLGLFFLHSNPTAALSLQELRKIPGDLIFQARIPNPSLVAECGERIFTFSIPENSLYAIHSTSGVSTRTYSFPIKNGQGTDLIALSCQGQKLLALVNGDSPLNRPQILEFSINPQIQTQGFLKKRLFPHKGRATDLFCSPRQCWVLQGKLWTSENLTTWKNISPPPLEKIPLQTSTLGKNPFEDWQSTLILAPGQWTKGTVSVSGQIALLDPSRSQVAVQTESGWKKWGSFGVWEGRFLQAKSLTYLSKNILAIADTQLKVVFLYRDNGEYLGVVTLPDGHLFSPDYSLGITSLGNQLYLADFQSNLVKALTLSDFSSDVESSGKLSLRQNLFRRPDLKKDSSSLLCLGCHDGTESNHLFKFTQMNQTHPIACTQCHDPHHQSSLSHHLIKPLGTLCLSCHQKHSLPENNHVWQNSKIKGGSCTDCHQAHTRNPSLVITPAPQMCLDCHQNQNSSHRAISGLLEIDAAKDLHFQNGKLSCTTCHQTHFQLRQEGFLKEKVSVQLFCASCHGNKADRLYKNFHKLMNAKGNSP